MTAKAYLGQAYHLDKRIDCRQIELDNLRSLAERTTTIMSDTPRSASPDPHRIQSIIAKIVDRSAEIAVEIDKLVDLKREISAVIEQVEDPVHRILLEYRYMSYLTWKAIAANMGYSTRRILQLHKTALENLGCCKTFH